MLKNLSVQDFINELSSSSPAPGGGSASALAAALASALGSMVFNLTVGKKAYKELSEENRRLIDSASKESDAVKNEFLELMERDTEAFLKLMSCFKLPKDTEAEKVFRAKRISEGYLEALEVPLEIAKKAVRLYDCILLAARYGNINAISDAGVASLLLQTAVEGAVLNVKINLASIGDDSLKGSIAAECARLIEEGNKKKSEIMDIVNSKIIL
jgi:methenyltetrahydrofolate cyclohydrolase